MGKFILRVASSGLYYFVLKAPDGQTIARSEVYATKQAALKVIQSVKTNAPEASIEDAA